MYTIKETSLRSGVPIATIRAWERRYGAVVPARTAAGYRLYDDDAVDRLVAMRQLVEIDGMRPHQAADRIREDHAAVAALADRARARSTPPIPTPVPAAGEAEAVRAFRDAVRRMDVAAIERLLDEVLATRRLELAMTSVVFPGLRGVGEDWADGVIDVAREHAASETVRRRLARAFDAAAGPSDRVDVLVGLPAGRHHELGVLTFAVAARRAGLGVVYLGSNVPVDSWAAAIRATAARVVVLGAIGPDDVAPARAVIAAVQSSTAAASVAIGGSVAPAVVEGTTALALPQPIEAAVEAVRELVRTAS